ncbi:MAG: class I SAM-dependent methyltransferase [Cryomorphaceae bacterium]|nr:class I SAM-dependent methyltransferase [Cryomorphaceae bacterium]
MHSKLQNETLVAPNNKSREQIDDQHQFSLRWMLFDQYKDAIRALRHRVFVEEQKLDDYVVDSPYDELGLHLGLFNSNELVSTVSMFVFPPGHPHLENLGITGHSRNLVQFSRRAELPEYRDKKMASLMVAFGIKSVFELFEPAGLFASLAGAHRRFRDSYNRIYGFNKIFEAKDGDEEVDVLLIDEPIRLKKLVLAMRNFSSRQKENHKISLPDLAHHIQSNQALAGSYHIDLDENNLYLQPLSLGDELPRLSAQARMLFLTQEKIWRSLLKNNPSIQNVLDMGCGPGVYLSLISKLPESKGKNLTGIDIDKDLIDYAKFSHPHIQWFNGSVYNVLIEDKKFDLVHTSFLFIHLLKPYLAIKEIHRILANQGYFIVTDVNDATFEGPDVIKTMVQKHSDMYEGNRKIMLEMNSLAETGGFSLVEEFTITTTNTGTENGPVLEGNHLRLGKWTMWAMFAFMGQRPEIEAEFELAESHYSTHNDDISIRIETKIYQKR